MAFLVETGAGVPGANSYASVAFALAYLTDRGRATENGWTASTTAAKQAALIAATDHIERRFGSRFRGTKARLLLEGRAATGTLTLTAVPLDTETLTLGDRVYRFVAALEQEDDVLIGATVAATLANLVAAFNAPSDSPDEVHEDTFPNYAAIASVEGSVATFTAYETGENGNTIELATTVTGATVSGALLAGGVDAGEQPLAFPRAALYSRDGAAIEGVPLKLRQATVEYAVRALSAPLAPDPTYDASLVGVQRKREKVGPIEEETEYVAGAVRLAAIPYPAADQLLTEFLSGTGGAIRA